MKTIPRWLPSLLLLWTVVGCSTPQSARIREHSTLFNALQPRIQEQIRNGIVKVGFTSDMVYMALGKPSSVTHASASDPREIWVYDRYVANPFVPIENPGSESSIGDPPRSSTAQMSFVADMKRLNVVIRSKRVIAVNLSD